MGDVRRLIAFDLDGTLVDSRRDLADSANALLRELGAAPLDEPPPQRAPTIHFAGVVLLIIDAADEPTAQVTGRGVLEPPHDTGWLDGTFRRCMEEILRVTGYEQVSSTLPPLRQAPPTQPAPRLSRCRLRR